MYTMYIENMKHADLKYTWLLKTTIVKTKKAIQTNTTRMAPLVEPLELPYILFSPSR